MVSDEDASYYEVNFDPADAFRFTEPNEEALTQLHAILASMPVRTQITEGRGHDSLTDATAIGPLSEVTELLSNHLRMDWGANQREVADRCNVTTFVTDSNLTPNALHIVTRLSPLDGKGGSTLYGARVQRIDADTYVLWSDY
jgi:hypothetical protein